MEEVKAEFSQVRNLVVVLHHSRVRVKVLPILDVVEGPLL